MLDKPSITAVIGEHVQLRRAGKEYLGMCPFHADKTPSFSVNEDKGKFYCFGCGAKGDVFDFVIQHDGIGFPEAKALLGVTDNYRPRPISPRQRQAAEVAAAWMLEQRRKVNVLLADVLEQIELADEIGDNDLAESFLREQSFLRDLWEDLDMARHAASLLSVRPSIEALTEGVVV